MRYMAKERSVRNGSLRSAEVLIDVEVHPPNGELRSAKLPRP